MVFSADVFLGSAGRAFALGGGNSRSRVSCGCRALSPSLPLFFPAASGTPESRTDNGKPSGAAGSGISSKRPNTNPCAMSDAASAKTSFLRPFSGLGLGVKKAGKKGFMPRFCHEDEPS
jgi:hypothetical protein